MDKEKVDFNWDEDKKGGLSDMLKRLLATSLSSPFLSEEQLRSYLSGLNLPKDVAVQVIKTAQKSKGDIVQKVGNEFSKLVQKVDIVKEFKNVLKENKISIRADIEFVPKDQKDQKGHKDKKDKEISETE